MSTNLNLLLIGGFDDASNYNFQDLEREQTVAVKNRDEYEEITQSESQQQGRNLQLEGSQIKEYHKLKEKAGKESARHLGELDSINREQKSDQVSYNLRNLKICQIVLIVL